MPETFFANEVAWSLAERSLEDYATLHGLRTILWLASWHNMHQLMASEKWRIFALSDNVHIET